MGVTEWGAENVENHYIFLRVDNLVLSSSVLRSFRPDDRRGPAVSRRGQSSEGGEGMIGREDDRDENCVILEVRI